MSTHLGPRLLPLQLISACLHGWMAIFLPSRSVASLPPGVTAYLASLVLCLTLHPAISSLMSRSAQLNSRFTVKFYKTNVFFSKDAK